MEDHEIQKNQDLLICIGQIPDKSLQYGQQKDQKLRQESFSNVKRLLRQYRQFLDVASGQERDILIKTGLKRFNVGIYISRSEECNDEYECIRKTNGSQGSAMLEDAAQASYMESQNTYTSLFENQNKYNAIISALADVVYWKTRKNWYFYTKPFGRVNKDDICICTY